MLRRFRAARDERGVSAIEYGVIAALIAVVIIAVVGAMGGSLSGVFGNVGTTIGNISPGGAGGGDEELCDAEGNYKGDIVWSKAHYDYGDDDYDLWLSYPASAHDLVVGALQEYSGTITVEKAASPAEDGVERVEWGSEYGMDTQIPTCAAATPDTPRDMQVCNIDGEPVPAYAYLVDSFWDQYGFKVTRPAGALWVDFDDNISAWDSQATTDPDETHWEIYRAPNDFGYGEGFTQLSDDGIYKRLGNGLYACDPNDRMWDDSDVTRYDDPNCTPQGKWTGGYDGWYWVKRADYYTPDGDTLVGTMTTTAAGDSWDGRLDETVSFSGRGEFLGEEHAVLDWAWFPLHGRVDRLADGTYGIPGTKYQYENGYFFIPDDQPGWKLSDWDHDTLWNFYGEDQTHATYSNPSWWYSERLYQPEDGVAGTPTWDGSKEDNGGVQMATPPEGADLPNPCQSGEGPQ